MIEMLKELEGKDYIWMTGLGYFIIKELLSIINKKMDKDDINQNNFQTQMINSQEKIAECLEKSTKALTEIGTICKNTDRNVNEMKTDVTTIKARIN
jgi:hypothetical protein